MIDVLVYLYENYGAFGSCPDAGSLGRSLADAGFDDEEIDDALGWLQGLARGVADPPSEALAASRGARVYAQAELRHLGLAGAGFLAYLDSAGQLTPVQRELVVERALAVPDAPLTLATVKVIVLMVLWSHAADVDFLLLEELLEDGQSAPAH